MSCCKFSEYLQFHGVSPDYLSSRGHAEVLNRLDQFLTFGGFPGLIHTDKAVSAIQVCESIQDRETRERESRGLLEACRRFALNSGLIITREEEEITMEGIRIKVIPVYKYLLSF